MDEQIKSILSQLELNEPVLDINIKKVEEQLRIKFPQEYYEFLLNSNGGEGSIGESYLVMWKVEDIIELNEAYGVEEFAPGLLIIGSDGGDTAYCIRSENKSFVNVPFIGMDLREVQVCGNNFEEFLSYLNKE
ncbi:SMI1/KNR4 family protein [Chengkuizengella sediminis]|uniref:SMI1/KNR4 family protein n=1 Tax=Chengkuizengella sediminis TaxID=1885917 RepID=UPI0013896170|nr:SMI1/KNR4 family protein [Chengkuizengella sediminis]NDI35093.1 SMI1/KNR4 family protein [Chengkuizengella sediminis]